jgi:hypothetical protein
MSSSGTLAYLEVEMTVDNAAVLQKLWTTKRVSNLAPHDEIKEVVRDNDNDLERLVGK